MTKKLTLFFLSLVEKLYLKQDQKRVRRTRNIQRIPDMAHRRGGKVAYGEWAHVTGIFQTLLYHILERKEGNQILDVGCGTGLLGLSAMPFVQNGGKYTGIDVIREDVEFCRKRFPVDSSEFIHFDLANEMYSKNQSDELKPWPISDACQDVVTALSVWTHLKERDALFYFKEVSRVLKPGGKAVISIFRLDDHYEKSLSIRKDATGRYHATNQNKWIFSEKAYNSDDWYTTVWNRQPEDAIAITERGIEKLLNTSGLSIHQYYPGNWKEMVGVYFQDILILEKK